MERAFAAGATRERLDELFDLFAAEYAVAEETDREKLRDAFSASSNWSTGAVWRGGPSYYRRFSGLQRDPRDLRRALVIESLLDGRDDVRDSIMAMDDLVLWARGDDVPYAEIFREVARMSSPKARLGESSIRSLMEARCG
jgi:hypothetical protein